MIQRMDGWKDEWLDRVQREFHPKQFLPSLTAGLVAGVLRVIYAISYATLIFSGPLSAFVSSGIGIALFSTAAIGVVVALSSSFVGALASPQGKPTAVLAAIAAAIAGAMLPAATETEVFFTIVAAIALVSLLTGLFFFVLGQFKLGGLVRFIPYPVMGGFLASSGWLLIKGAIGMMSDLSLGMAQLPILFEPDVLVRWLPGVVYGLLLFFVLRRYKHFFVMPALILAGVGLFYAVLLSVRMTVAEAGAQGWLLGPFPGGGLWHPLDVAALRVVDWSLILNQLGSVATVLVVSVISILLTTSGLELAAKQDLDLNRELKVAGVANIVSAAGGGMVGYHLLSASMLGRKMGAHSRLVGVFSSAVCAVLLFLGAAVLSFFPKPILGGLLFFAGLGMLVEWVYDAWFKLPKSDYLIVLLIVVVASTVGFLEGVAVGVIAGIILFVVKYSRINVVKHALSGTSYQSNVERSIYHQNLLRSKGEKLYVLELQGFIFFGTANGLFEQVRQRARDPLLSPLQFVLLDFRLVNGLDSSAVLGFAKMKQLAERYDFTLVLTNLSLLMRRSLERGEVLAEQDERMRVFTDLDHGIEWCEDQFLLSDQITLVWYSSSFEAQLKNIFPESVSIDDILKYFERKDVDKGYCLLRQGDPSDSLYFLELGQVTVQLDLGDGKKIRLRTMNEGTVVGEMGLYLNTPRTASVVTEMPSRIYCLSASALQEMEERDPQIAAAFHKFMARLLAARLTNNNRTIKALLD